MGRVKVLACIPARYGSTRFPGKVLAKDTGKFLIEHTWLRAKKAKLVDRVLIAADDPKIRDAALSFGAECVLTSPDHPSGTDRIGEAAADSEADIVVNLQADEPEIDPKNIDFLVKIAIDNFDCPMATLASPFQTSAQIADPNIVKVIVDSKGRAIYFSRSPIPYDRAKDGVGDIHKYLRHLGIYAYRKDFLSLFTSLPEGDLERTERLEQLRVLENGYRIIVGKVDHFCDGIDTPEQYQEFVKRYRKQPTH